MQRLLFVMILLFAQGCLSGPDCPPVDPKGPPDYCREGRAGSPLVLDLDDDGIRTTSVAEGVLFDLLGEGLMQVAWLRQGDAFLALDRNHNGQIDGGWELFGSATPVRPGQLAADGFIALSLYDRPQQGGNGDGLIDERDHIFAQLSLWEDANHDGRSDQGELRSLKQAGIRALSLAGQRRDIALDENGNDLSLRGTFVRDDGRPGLLVDVFFRVLPR